MLLPIFILSIFIFFIILLIISKLHDYITEIDLKPSLTQFLIAAIFTPIILISIYSYQQNANTLKDIENDNETENIKFADLESKYNSFEFQIKSYKIHPKDYLTEKNLGILEYKLKELNKAFSDYKTIYIKNQLNKVLNWPIARSPNPYNININLNTNQLQNVLQTCKNKKESSQVEIEKIEQSFKKLTYNELKMEHEDSNKISKIISTPIKAMIFFQIILLISISFFIFSFFIIFLKTYYIEKIIYEKLKKIQETKESLSDFEKNDINSIKDAFKLNGILKRKLKLCSLDKKLSLIIAKNHPNKSLIICDQLLI